MNDNLLIFTTALLTSLALVPVLRTWALNAGKVDTPDARKVHTRAIPRLGGIAIFLAFLFACVIFLDMTREVRGLLAGALVVFCCGLLDDLYGLSPKKKFAGEIIGVLLTIVISRLTLANLGNPLGLGPLVLPLWLAIPFTLFAVVGVINAINLIDGLDGLSGGVSVIALVAYMALGFHGQDASVVALCAALLGGLLGFLRYNRYPARIFMGDAGSLTLGFVLAFLAIMLTQRGPAPISPLASVVVLGVPLMDTIWVMTHRVMRGESPFAPDKTHLHHKFLDLGLEHRYTVVVIYLISLGMALLGIVGHDAPDYLLLGSYLVTAVSGYLGLRHLLLHQPRYRFLPRDSRRSFRETAAYARWVKRADRLLPLMRLLLFWFALLLLYVVVMGEATAAAVATLILLVGVCLLIVAQRRCYRYLQAVAYLAGLVAIKIVEQAAATPVVEGISVGQVAYVGFWVMLALVVVKVLFRADDELYVGIAEVKALATGVFALVAFSRLPELAGYANIPLYGSVLYLAMKILDFNRRRLDLRGEKDIPLGEGGEPSRAA